MTISGLFNYSSKGILGGAFVISVAALASRGLGFVRNALLASTFGAGDILDAYFLAFRLPDLFFNLFFFGALSAGFVPVFIKLRETNPREAWSLAQDIFNLALLVFSTFGLIFFFAAPWILARIAPGFSDDVLELSISMARIMFLQPVFLGLSGIFSGVLQSERKFLSYSLAPIFYNAGIIAGILLFEPIIGSAGLAWGVVFGALLHLAIQYPATRAAGWRWRPVVNVGMSALKRVFSVMVPRSLGLIVQQLDLIILVSLATAVGAGSVAVFNFANDLYSFPLGIVVIPVGVAAFPAFVSALRKGPAELGAVFLRTLRNLLFLLSPLVVLAIVLRAQVVRLTLGYGKFGWEDTILTIDTLTFFLIGLIFHGVLGLVMRGFFALEDAKTPLVVLLFGTGVTAAIAFLVREPFGVAGLSLGFSIGMIVSSSILFWIFVQRIGIHKKIPSLIVPIGRFLAASLGAGIIARGVLFAAAEYIIATERVWGLAVQAGLATVAGVVVYIVILWLLRAPEIGLLQNKFGFRPPAAVLAEPLPEEELPK